MILRCVCWSVFLGLVLGSTVNAQVTVDDQGYQNVLISFSPNIPSEKGKELVQSIQNILESTSSVLNKAIGIRIASATFLLPPSWSTETWKDITVSHAYSHQTSRRPDIRVDGNEDSPFGKQPATLQHGGCGVSGHEIILPLTFTSETTKYPKGKLLAREWLKYRYGVFDENGFQGDELYPPYYKIQGKPEIKITECTDSNVTYVFKYPILGEECEVDSPGLFGYCRAYPDEKSAANVTSSLMYFHEDLTNMEHICGKDGHHHDITAPNKQNSLCNGQSIWDVIKSSKDFKNTQQQPDPNPKKIKFSYIQENKPRIVVLLENTDNLLEKDIPSAIQFALRRLYYDLPPKSKMAIYTYNTDVTGVLPFTELPIQEKRQDLGVIADFGSLPTGVLPSMGLSKAVQLLLTNSEEEKSFIFLIAASPLDKVPEFPKQLKKSEICLNVLRLTNKNHADDESYLALANSFGCHLSYRPLKMSSDAKDIFSDLSSFLRSPVPNFNDNFETTVAFESISAERPVKIPRNPAASLYTLWLARQVGSINVVCKAGDTVITLKPGTKATEIASFTFDPVEDDVTCNLASAKQQPILTEVQMRTENGLVFDFDTWIHDKSTETEQLPIIIYAKIYFSGYPVKNANVTTVVTSGSRQKIVTMLDNGKGDPDVTQFDGIYSGYFTGFLEKGDYQISVKVNDNEGKAKIGKDANSSVSDACCGSTIKSQDYDIPAFSVEKVSVYTAKNKAPKDGYRPPRILDLKVILIRYSNKVILYWTTPEGGTALKYLIKLFESREDAVDKFDTTGRELNISSVPPRKTGQSNALLLPCADLEEDVTYFVAMRSLNEFNKPSEISNVVEFLPRPKEETTGESSSSTPASTTDGRITTPEPVKGANMTLTIVLGVIGGIVALIALSYFIYHFIIKKSN